MKYILFFLFVSVSVYAQNTYFVKDKNTQSPIAYASIYNNSGTFKINSENDGSFIIPEEFKKETFIIQSIGYETIETNLENTVIFLEDKAETLEELVIIPRLGTKEIKVGNDITQKSSLTYGNDKFYGTNIKKGMKFFVDNTIYSYLKEINLKTKSKVKEAKFEIRIYDVNENGEPGELLHDGPIYGIAQKGNSITKINLENLKLKLHSDSFFVFFEPLFLEKNSYSFRRNGMSVMSYSPELHYYNVIENSMWFGFKLNGEQQWNPYFFTEHKNRDKKIYLNFQIEVILTN